MKRTSIEIKKKIISFLKKDPLTYAQLERKVNTGFRTIKQNCEELKIFGFIEIEKIQSHPKNGKPSYKIKITEKGKEQNFK